MATAARTASRSAAARGARSALAASLIVLSGCSDDRERFTGYPPPAMPAAPRIALIGNSITLHPPKPELGWQGDHGMAASRPDKDYAHRLLDMLSVPVTAAYIRNFYPFETDGAVRDDHLASLQTVFASRPDIIVLQLGDNVTVDSGQPLETLRHLYSFWFNFGALAKAAGAASDRLFCVSTWWETPLTDFIIRHHCSAHGGRVVHIGDIFGRPGNPDRSTRDFTNVGVDIHPKDDGMLQIALRLKHAIDTTEKVSRR
ncbi:hypothetical protein [Methyloversatilis thermotolerans]|uniref:hypothetical protein n=1 Tax=Methyloversatilis thermotolerans TaxID=1346290 RepID=UPI00037F1D1B|nr:hypothetical protein [Methyloversatilis thermotolerans]